MPHFFTFVWRNPVPYAGVRSWCAQFYRRAVHLPRIAAISLYSRLLRTALFPLPDLRGALNATPVIPPPKPTAKQTPYLSDHLFSAV
jgi:hypothetical protein